MELLKEYEDKVQKYLSVDNEMNWDLLVQDMKPKLIASMQNFSNNIAKGDSPMAKLMKNMFTKGGEQDSIDPTDSSVWQAKISDNPFYNAFEQKTSAHSSSGSNIVPPPVVDKAAEFLSMVPRKGRSTVYINVPFCQTRCSYCMFYLTAYRKEESKRYTDTLIKELHIWQNRRCQNVEPIQAVYFGGGTPTALEAEDLYRLIKAVKDILPLASDCEITIEGRLSYFGENKIEQCLKAGANRFSLGVQTFDTEIRQKLQRISNTEELINSLNVLCGYNSAAVVIDLIFGLPGQTLDSWKRDIDIASSLPLNGVDLYQMLALPNSPMIKMIADGKLSPLPNNSQKADMYQYGCNKLLDINWKHITVSHFAKDTRERNIYNMLAKGDADTLAFGPGAGGKIQGASFMNIRDYKEWINAVENNRKPIAMMFTPKSNWRLYKDIGEQVELGFVDWHSLSTKHRVELQPLVTEIIKQWENAGLLTNNSYYSRLTLAGKYWAVNMSQILINYISAKL